MSPSLSPSFLPRAFTEHLQCAQTHAECLGPEASIHAAGHGVIGPETL